MDSVSELRMFAAKYWVPEGIRKDLQEIAGRIESEIAEGYIPAPLDADGVPTCIGDKMQGITGKIETVRFLMCSSDGWTFNESGAVWRQVERYRHYHASTIEDVLREFSVRVINSGHQWGLDEPDTIAEFAEKLRLAGDAQ